MLASDLWRRLIEWDHALFEKINAGWTNPFFDWLMPWVRVSLNWAPLYLFLLVFVLVNFKVKGLWWAVFFLATVALTDMTGTYAIKHVVERIRPCNNPEVLQHIRLLARQCAGGYSFISNHAANHFGMAAFFLISFRHVLGRWAWIAIGWAALISYAQVYVGVHYPADVLAGAALGIVMGISTGSLFNKRFGFAIFGH